MNSHKEYTIQLKALKVVQPVGEFFIAVMKPKDLVLIAKADVRRMDQRDVERYLGIQRELSIPRVKKIQEYVRRSDATFPTSIILSVNDKCASFDEKTNCLTLKEYYPEEGSDEEPIRIHQLAQILDGQHRIAGFYHQIKSKKDIERYTFDEELGDLDFDLNISFIIGADIAEQANIFATVNHTQTKVNKSLVYDLLALSESRSPQKSCHKIAMAMDSEKVADSPLRGRIKRLGVATPGRKGQEPITQAAFVESLIKYISTNPGEDRDLLKRKKKLQKATKDELIKTPFRNLFIEDKDVDIFQIIFNYFKAVEEKWPDAWKDFDTLLPKSNAFRALMRHLGDTAYLEAVDGNIGEIPTSEDFFKILDRVELKDSDFTTKNFVHGAGGQMMLYKVLSGQMDASELFEAKT